MLEFDLFSVIHFASLLLVIFSTYTYKYIFSHVVSVGNVIFYGSTLDVYCCVNTLLEIGLPGNRIVIVQPPTDSQVSDTVISVVTSKRIDHVKLNLRCDGVTTHQQCIHIYLYSFNVLRYLY